MANPAIIGSDWRSKYPTAEQQAEFFLLKFSHEADVSRDKVFSLKKQFEKFDKRSQGELEEDEAMHLLEARNETKTFRELRQTFSDIDIDQNHKLSFLEFACGTFNKSWAKLHAPSVDPEEIARAESLASVAYREHSEKMAKEAMARELENQKQLEKLQAAAARADAESSVEAAKAAREALEAEIKRQADERKRQDDEEIEYRRKREEEYQQKRAAELAQKGVAGKAALFKYAAEDATKDTTRLNEERIKAEAAKRKAEKEAKAKAEEDKKKAEEETERRKHAADEAAKKVAEAEEQAKIAAADKAVAEAERLEAEKKAAEAEAERQKALAGEEVAKKEREAYEAAKAAAEAEAAAKKAEEEKKRNDGRARIAQRAALWNAGAPAQVFDELAKGNVALAKTATRETNSALATAKLFAGIQKGAELKHVNHPSTELTDAQKQAFLEDRQNASQ